MMETSEAINEIAEALVKAQTAIKAPTKNREVEVKMRTGGKYKFRYATLDSVIEHVRKPLTENGLWFIQTAASREDVAVMETMLMHKSGQWIKGEQPLRIDGQGNQEVGSAVTYAKRYGLCAMLGLAADEDDDANAADGNAVRDIAAGVGTMPAAPPRLELFTPWNEVEDRFEKPEDYLSALTMKVNEVGAYWPANEDMVTVIGQYWNADKDIVKHARQVFKLGKDAWKQSPDNPKNKQTAE
jgi:hypothetical protein